MPLSTNTGRAVAFVVVSLIPGMTALGAPVAAKPSMVVSAPSVQIAVTFSCVTEGNCSVASRSVTPATISVTVGGAPVQFSASSSTFQPDPENVTVTAVPNYLVLTEPSTGTLSVSVIGSEVVTGTGIIVIGANGVSNSPQVVPVTAVTSCEGACGIMAHGNPAGNDLQGVTITPASISFPMVGSAGGISALMAQIGITNETGISATGTDIYATSDWIVVPPTGAAGGLVSISVNPAGLPANYYYGQVTFSLTGCSSNCPDAGGGIDVYLYVENAVSSLSPSSAPGGEAFTLTISGSGFVNGATVNWGATSIPATVQSSTMLTASIPSGVNVLPGAVAITVTNPDGYTSAPVSFASTAPLPTVTALNPPSVTAGAPAFPITVTGTGFDSATTVNWNGMPLPTIFNSSTSLTATVSANLIALPGNATITVTASTGLSSLGLLFYFNASVPSIGTVTVAGPPVPGGPYVLTIGGSNFGPTTVVQWNSESLPTTYISSNQLTASVSASLTVTPATVPITVVNGVVASGAYYVSVPFTQLTSALAHLAVGGAWTTGIFVINTSNQPANFSIAFYDSTGAAVALPFSTGTTGVLSATLPAMGSAYYEASNPAITTIPAWGLVTASPAIVAQALFREQTSYAGANVYYEAAVPAASGAGEFLIPFNANTFAPTSAQLYTGFGIANLSPSQSANVTCTARDVNGNVIPNGVPVITMNPLGHYAGYQFQNLTGETGTLDCVSNTTIAAVALRFIGTATVSSLPVINNPSTVAESVSGSSSVTALAQLAYDGAWTTGIFIVNTSTHTAPYSIAFFDSNGASTSLPFSTGSVNVLSGTIPPQGMKYIETTGNPSLSALSAWGLVTADPAIVVQALFREYTNGSYFEAAVPSNPGENQFSIPFNAGTFAPTGDPLYTGFAIANMAQAASTVTCTAFAQNGSVIQNGVPPTELNPLGHFAGFTFPNLTGQSGTLTCNSTTNVAPVALRFIGASTVSSLPVIIQ